jgi:hypothetical protein
MLPQQALIITCYWSMEQSRTLPQMDSPRIATPPTRGVRTSKTATIVDVDTTPAVSSTSRKSILQLATMNTTQGFNPALANDDDSQSKSHLKEIHDQTNQLFCIFSDDGMKEKNYHVTDFAGLYLVWPIIEFSMSPTMMAKDD